MADLMTASCTQNTDRECREEDCCLKKQKDTCECLYPDLDIGWGREKEFCKKCGKNT